MNFLILILFIIFELILFHVLLNKIIKSNTITNFYIGLVILLTGVFTLFKAYYIALILIPFGIVVLKIYIFQLKSKRLKYILISLILVLITINISYYNSNKNFFFIIDQKHSIISNKEHFELVNAMYNEFSNSAFFSSHNYADQKLNQLHLYNNVLWFGMEFRI